MDSAQRAYRLMASGTIDNRLDLALSRYNLAVERDYLMDQLIDCWIGLETLFAPEIGTEIKYRIRLRAARFLGKKAREREELFDFLGTSYNARSKIVHGDDPPQNLSVLTERTHQVLRDSILSWLDPTREHDIKNLDAAALSGGS